MHRYNFEALDKCLRDLNRNSSHGTLPFGGHVVMFCGDFRQIPTMIPRGSRAAIVGASLRRSYLWDQLRKMESTINMRVLRLAGKSNDEHACKLTWCMELMHFSRRLIST